MTALLLALLAANPKPCPMWQVQHQGYCWVEVKGEQPPYDPAWFIQLNGKCCAWSPRPGEIKVPTS